MRINQNRPLWTSALLHLVVLLCLLLTTIIEAFLPKEERHVFEMISELDPQYEVQPESAALMESLPDPVLPDLQPIDIPDLAVPEPIPTEQAAPQLMSIEDFRRENPLKPIKPRMPQTTRPNYKAPTIDTSKISQDLQRNLPATVYETSASLTAAERTALKRYGDQLNRRLNRAWMKPEKLDGISLVATVVFDVSRAGRISNIRLSPSSGNASFDASVKAAFSKVGSGGVTPTGEGHRFTMSFKMAD